MKCGNRGFAGGLLDDDVVEVEVGVFARGRLLVVEEASAAADEAKAAAVSSSAIHTSEAIVVPLLSL